MKIRTATIQDRNEIQAVHLSAFPKAERVIVAKLAMDLLSGNTRPQTISLIAESGGVTVGHVAFSPVTTGSDADFLGYILAPLGVKPEYQRLRVGSKLVEYGLRELSGRGVNVVFVYGDPNYYGRFGFGTEAARRYTAPYALQYPFGWQAIVFNDCGTGKVPAAITCVTPLCDPKFW